MSFSEENLEYGSRKQQAFATALLLVLCTCLLSRSEGQLNERYAAFNPLSGQGKPPEESVSDLPVRVKITLEKLLNVSAPTYSFQLGFFWNMIWEDPRALKSIQAPYETCNFFCGSRVSFLLNDAGQPACCDDVFVPEAEATTAIGYDGQMLPFFHYLQPTGKLSELSYTTYVQGSFSASFGYGSYPWDKHYLCLDIETAFRPILDPLKTAAQIGAYPGIEVESQRQSEGFEYASGSYRPPSRVVDLSEWEVGRVWLEVIKFSEWTTSIARVLNDGFVSGGAVKINTSSNGVRFCLDARRQTRSYYVVSLVLPLTLITLFSFGLFSLSRHIVKDRIDNLATLFLAVTLLQFVLAGVSPSSVSVNLPIWLILVSYVYTFLMATLSVAAHAMVTQPLRRHKQARRRTARTDFIKWRRTLQKGRQEPGPSEPTDTQGGRSADDTPAETQLSTETRLSAETRFAAGNHVTVSASPPVLANDNKRKSCWQRLLCWGVPRNLRLLHSYAALAESGDYLDNLVQEGETWARRFLVVTYLASVGILCSVAAHRAEEVARFHTLPYLAH